MGRRLMAVVAALVASVVACSSAAADDLDTPGCVTKNEWSRVEEGWSIERVHQVFGTDGESGAIDGAAEGRSYPGCPTDTEVKVWYVDGRVVLKRWYP